MPLEDVVVTGVGVVCPIGIGADEVWESLCVGRSGVREFHEDGLPVRVVATVEQLDPKQFVRNRKSLKIMSRDAVLGVAASSLALQDAGIASGGVDPVRCGVTVGADPICPSMEETTPAYRLCVRQGVFDFSRWGDGMTLSYPLGFLRILPNMIASHVAIAHDAQGPNNTIHQGRISGLLAISEAAGVIQRGAADVMIAGGASSRLTRIDWNRLCVLHPLSRRTAPPPSIMRPFDADRDGTVIGEGAGMLVLERRRHAERRGAKILGWLRGWACCCENGREPSGGRRALGRAISESLNRAGLSKSEVGHVNAHGLSTWDHDRIEARAIVDALDGVPVTAPKSYFGNLEAAGGAVELAVSVLSFKKGVVPATLNYERPDPECPIEVISGQPLGDSAPTAVAINWTDFAQAAAVVISSENL